MSVELINPVGKAVSCRETDQVSSCMTYSNTMDENSLPFSAWKKKKLSIQQYAELYYTFFLLGIGDMIMYQCILNSVYDIQFKIYCDSNLAIRSVPLFMTGTIAMNLMMIILEVFRFRLLLAVLVAKAICCFLILLIIFTVPGNVGSLLLGLLIILCGILQGILHPSTFALAGIMPRNMIAAVSAGIGMSGIVAFMLQLFFSFVVFNSSTTIGVRCIAAALFISGGAILIFSRFALMRLMKKTWLHESLDKSVMYKIQKSIGIKSASSSVLDHNKYSLSSYTLNKSVSLDSTEYQMDKNYTIDDNQSINTEINVNITDINIAQYTSDIDNVLDTNIEDGRQNIENKETIDDAYESLTKENGTDEEQIDIIKNSSFDLGRLDEENETVSNEGIRIKLQFIKRLKNLMEDIWIITIANFIVGFETLAVFPALFPLNLSHSRNQIIGLIGTYQFFDFFGKTVVSLAVVGILWNTNSWKFVINGRRNQQLSNGSLDRYINVMKLFTVPTPAMCLLMVCCKLIQIPLGIIINTSKSNSIFSSYAFSLIFMIFLSFTNGWFCTMCLHRGPQCVDARKPYIMRAQAAKIVLLSFLLGLLFGSWASNGFIFIATRI